MTERKHHKEEKPVEKMTIKELREVALAIPHEHNEDLPMTQKDKPSSDMLKRYFKRDLFAHYVGIELIDAHNGYAKTSLIIKEHHLNGVRRVHGGVIFTLADLAFAAASNSQGRVAVAINASIQFLRAPKGNALFAEAREISCDHKLASYEIMVTDETGEVISVFQGMVYRKKETTDYFEKG